MEVSRLGMLVVSMVLLIGAVGLILNQRVSSAESEIAVLKQTAGIGPGAVDTARLASNAVTSAKIADSAVTTDKLEDSAVTSAKIADLTIVVGDIATGAVTTAKIADLAVTDEKLATGGIPARAIADGAVMTAKIADLNVTRGKIADNAIDNTKLYENAVLTHYIAAGAVTSGKILDGTIVDADISPTADIAGSKILANSITSAQLADTIAVNAISRITENVTMDNVVMENIRVTNYIWPEFIKAGSATAVDVTITGGTVGNQETTTTITFPTPPFTGTPLSVVVDVKGTPTAENIKELADELLFRVTTVTTDNFNLATSYESTVENYRLLLDVYWTAVYYA